MCEVAFKIGWYVGFLLIEAHFTWIEIKIGVCECSLHSNSKIAFCIKVKSRLCFNNAVVVGGLNVLFNGILRLTS